MPKISPMRLLRIPEAFDHPEWIWEPKIDGFRALAHVRGHHCALISRNGHTFKSWPHLNEEIAHAVRANDAILDGEIVCLDADGRANFKNLLFRREWPYFLAFDILALERTDLCPLPLLERKRHLTRVVPTIDCRLRLVEHVRGRGIDLFNAASVMDLEGVVGKWASGSYLADPRLTSWVKVKNPTYSQMEGRHELFDRRSQDGRSRQRSGKGSLALALS